MQTNSRIDKPTRTPARAPCCWSWPCRPGRPHHEEQRRAEAAEDGDEGQEHEIFHGAIIRRDGVTRAERFWIVTLARRAGHRRRRCALGAWQLGRAPRRSTRCRRPIEAQQRAAAAVDSRRSLAAGDAAATGCTARCVLRGRWVAAAHGLPRQPADAAASPASTWSRRCGSKAATQSCWCSAAGCQRNFMRPRRSCRRSQTPAGRVEVRGRIAPPPGQAIRSSTRPSRGAHPAESRPGRVPRPKPACRCCRLSRAADRARRPKACCATGRQPASGVEKHYGYAFQWWALRALIAILYVWFQFIAPRRQARRA